MPPDLRADAEENLRVIRALLERATIYRALSAPTAALGGALSLLCASYQILATRADPTFPREGDVLTVAYFLSFYVPWAAVFLATLAANLFFLWRGSVQRNEPFFSSGMRLASQSLGPAFITACVVTVCLAAYGANPLVTAISWSIFYGLGLLATAPFAPSSISRLGWAFLTAGLLAALNLFVPTFFENFSMPDHEAFTLAAYGLAASFGGFHLIYAAAVGLGSGKE